MTNQRNLLLAVLLSAVLLFGWDAATRYFYPQPDKPAATASATATTSGANGGASATPTPHSRQGGLTNPADIAVEKADLKTALASPDRVKIDAPRVAGSINLVGAVIDDVVLKDHRETVEKDSGPIRIFSPAGTPAQQFARFGWTGNNLAVPGPDTRWQADGAVLTQKTPITLSHDNGAGLRFEIRLTIDENYMITAQQSVANTGTNAAVVQPIAQVNRTSRTASMRTACPDRTHSRAR